MKLEQKLLQEINRYKTINRYVTEQAAPPPPAAPEDDSANAGDMAGGTPPADSSSAGATAPPPPGDTGGASPAGDAGATTPPPPGDSATSSAPMADDLPNNDTEKIDVTDLVNMQKDLQQKLEQGQSTSQDAIHKMDSIFSKLDDLANQLQQMDNVVAKIDDLEKKVSEFKPMTPEEKLNLRSYDSYPFSQKLSDFFADKKPEMEKTGKNTYVLTQDDGTGYSKDDISKSFDNF
jgi:hypothetical protein